jgi:DnaJ like chaperone protein
MGMLGKLVGGTIGFAMGGPLGAIAGAVFGHAFDKSGDSIGYIETESFSAGNQTAQLTFFVAAFSMLAKIARADGELTPEEVDSVERFMAVDLNLDPESRRVARDIFHAAVHSRESFQDFAAQFYDQFRNEPRLLEMMIDIMLRVSVSDSNMSQTEERMILSAIRIFNVEDAQYQRIKSKYVSNAVKYYAVIGCDESDTNEQIKKQYRKLVSEFHPDKIASKGLPDAFIQFANEKFREIQEAYEEIKKIRDIR